MKKPIRIIITDFHLKEGNEDEVISLFEQLKNTCLELQVKVVYIMGDCFYHRKKQSMEILLLMKILFNTLTKEGIKIHCFPGNHDKTNQSSTLSYLGMYENEESVFVHEDIDNDIYKDINFLFFPFFTDEVYLEKLDELKQNLFIEGKKNILLTHIAVNGVTNNDGTVVNNGIKQILFDEFDKILIGHYHNSSRIGKKIFYVGSSIPHNFGENNDKGLIVFYDDCSHELRNINFVKYHKLVFDANDKLKIEKAFLKHRNTEEKVRFIFEGTTDELASIDEKKYRKVGIDVKYKNKDIVVYSEQQQEEIVFEFNDVLLKKEFIRYCKEINADSKKMSFGLKYLKYV